MTPPKFTDRKNSFEFVIVTTLFGYLFYLASPVSTFIITKVLKIPFTRFRLSNFSVQLHLPLPPPIGEEFKFTSTDCFNDCVTRLGKFLPLWKILKVAKFLGKF